VVIRLHEAAFRAIEAEAAASLDEVGGILVGKASEWQGTLYVDVEAALPAERTPAGPAHITFTADAWAELLRRKDEEIPGGWIVGWYHSHPQMDIFLSHMDLSLHRHFFPQPWHVAMVINGQDRTAGFFAWDDDDIAPVRRFAYGDRSRVTFDFDHVPATYDIDEMQRSSAIPMGWLLALGAGVVLLVILGTGRTARGGRS
jgi:proteasome lid subunit RPN8/RPN11